jgi:tryptophan-rich sensory protein
MSTLDPRPTLASQALGMGAFVAAAVVAAASGALTSTGAAEQYGALVQPAWAPPPWLFGPVWTVLYALIAVSGWLVWRRAGWSGARTALTVYAVQLVLNALWTPLFFGAGLFGIAFAEIVLLAAVIVATIVLFARHSRTAAAMLVPYLLWVSFAAALTFAIWTFN